MRSALACWGGWGGRMANDALADSPRQCGPFQLAESTSAEMAYNPSIGYFRPKVSERVRRVQEIADWLDKLGLGQYAQRFAENDIAFSSCLI